MICCSEAELETYLQHNFALITGLVLFSTKLDQGIRQRFYLNPF